MPSKSEQLLIGREKEQELLLSLLKNGDPISPCIVLTGPPGSGKSHLVCHTFKILENTYGIKWILISCLDSGSQTYTSVGSPKLMFQLILHSIKSHYLPTLSENCLRYDGTAGFLTSICELLKLISEESGKVSLGIIFEQADKLRDADPLLLPLIVRLGTLVDNELQSMDIENTCKLFTILVTKAPWEKFTSGTFYLEPYVIAIDSYSKEQMTRIMLSLAPIDAPKDRFARFVDLLLTVCFPVCRSARELIHLMRVNWPAFEDPVTKGLVAPDDEWGQWKLAQPFLKHSLATLYLRPQKAQISHEISGSRCNYLELPYFTRFLLIAAFMASYNPRTADKKFLVKNSGKLSNRQKRQEKFAVKTNTQSSGPRVFPLDRMLAIFNVLVQEDTTKVPFTSLILSQVACLTSLGLLGTTNQSTAVGGLFTTGPVTKTTTNADLDPLSNPKYRCLASLDTVKQIAQSVDFDLLAHLTDFCTT